MLDAKHVGRMVPLASPVTSDYINSNDSAVSLAVWFEIHAAWDRGPASQSANPLEPQFQGHRLATCRNHSHLKYLKGDSVKHPLFCDRRQCFLYVVTTLQDCMKQFKEEAGNDTQSEPM